MEAFSLLKFWKSSAAASAGLGTPLPAAATILTAENSDDEASAGGDDGPFFDLEFAGAVSDGEEEDVAEVVCVDGEGGEVEESEMEELVKFRVSSAGGSGSERSDPNLPGEDLEEILALESGSDPNSGKPLVFPVSLLRSATRLRILMSGFKRSSRPAQAQPDPKQPQQRKKLFTIKFKPGEVPIVSLFSRDHSSRPVNGVVSSFSSSSSSSSTSSSSSSSSSLKPSADSEQQPPPASDEKLNPKDKVQKYIKMVKPLYIRVSKRYGEKLGFSGQLSSGSASPLPDDKLPVKSPEKEKATEKESEKKIQGNLGVGLKVMMKKRLSGKMKSPEAAVVHPAAARRLPDDLVQQQEWIQGAILHCKRSFNAPRDEESASVLIGSLADPSHQKTVGQATQNDVVGGRQFNSDYSVLPVNALQRV